MPTWVPLREVQTTTEFGENKLRNLLPTEIVDQLSLLDDDTAVYHNTYFGVFRARHRVELRINNPPTRELTVTTHSTLQSILFYLCIPWLVCVTGSSVMNSDSLFDSLTVLIVLNLIGIGVIIFLYRMFQTFLSIGTTELNQLYQAEGYEHSETTDKKISSYSVLFLFIVGLLQLIRGRMFEFTILTGFVLILVYIYFKKYTENNDLADSTPDTVESDSKVPRNSQEVVETDFSAEKDQSLIENLPSITVSGKSKFSAGYYGLLFYGALSFFINTALILVSGIYYFEDSLISVQQLALLGAIVVNTFLLWIQYKHSRDYFDYERTNLIKNRMDASKMDTSEIRDSTLSILRVLGGVGVMAAMFYFLTGCYLLLGYGMYLLYPGTYLWGIFILGLVVPAYIAVGGVIQIYSLLKEVWKIRTKQAEVQSLFPDKLDSPTLVVEAEDQLIGNKLIGGTYYIIISSTVKQALQDKSEAALLAVLAHEDAHIQHGDTRLVRIIKTFSCLFFIPKNILYFSFDFRAREFRADDYAQSVPGTNLEDGIDILSREGASNSYSGFGGDFSGKIDLQETSAIHKLFSIYHGGFGLTQIHPDDDQRKARLEAADTRN